MKKTIRISFVYAIAAMASGVFYREFTKYNRFTGVAGIGHILTGVGIVLLLLSLRKAAESQ